MTLRQIKRLVARPFRYSAKVRDLIGDGFYDESDLRHCIEMATRISKRQRDEIGGSVHGEKYVIEGRDTHGRPFYTVGKVIRDPEDVRYFFITAHQSDTA